MTTRGLGRGLATDASGLGVVRLVPVVEAAGLFSPGGAAGAADPQAATVSAAAIPMAG
jgi:hypothetical protein